MSRERQKNLLERFFEAQGLSPELRKAMDRNSKCATELLERLLENQHAFFKSASRVKSDTPLAGFF